MVWMAFGAGILLGGLVGMMVTALAVVAGVASAEERLNEAYREGCNDGGVPSRLTYGAKPWNIGGNERG